MEKFLNFIKQYLLLTLFTAFILIISIVDIVSPDRKFSEMENKELAQFPEFTMKSFLDNEFTMKFEKYINEQFFLRDQWLELKAVGDIGFAKTSSAGVILGKKGQLFAQNFGYEEHKFKNNIKEVKEYMDKHDNAKIMLVPSAYTIYPELLPLGAEKHLVNQVEQIQTVKNELGENRVIDVTDVLKSKKDEYIYYRTDHHWTTRGAYLAYEHIMKQYGITPMDFSEMQKYRKDVEDFRGTNYRKWKRVDLKFDTISYYDFPIKEMTIDHKKELETKVYGTQKIDNMYMEDAFLHVDKYEALLYGNNGLSIIRNDVNPENPRSILVIKDSYANSLVPFLTRHFDNVTVVDPRGLTTRNVQYLNSKTFDEILFLYSLEGFQQDPNVFKINL